MENLKNVVLNELDEQQVSEHKQSVLNLKEDEIVEYLKFAIDTFYLTEEEGENNQSVVTFFDSDEFKPFYEKIMNEEGFKPEGETEDTEE